MLRKLYQKTLSLAASRNAPWWLAAVSFAESSFFPIPPDVLLAPMVLARRDKAYVYAAICTAASVIGGCFGYAIGYFAGDLGLKMLALMGHKDGLEAYRHWYEQWGLWVILIKGATPIPYKLVTIASGLAAFSFPMFVAASVLTRGLRFFGVAFILERFGPAMLPTIEKRLYLITGVVVALIIAGFVLVRMLG
ncbi:MAG: YqaA family protein [Caulobacteraceae bacterium]